MTRAVVHEFGDGAAKDGAAVLSVVAADVNFMSKGFPEYRIGADDGIIDTEEPPEKPSLKDMVAAEVAELQEQQKRLSVRDLADKFENGLAAATAKLSDEAKWSDVASLDRHVLLKKLRDVLETLRGRVAGRNKDDAEEAISMVEALAVQLTRREGELLHEKAEVKRLATFLKQASEDAKKVVEEERALARAEIGSAKEALQRVQDALDEQEHMPGGTGKQELDELLKEVQEARRIKMLHQPSRVMDMEHELNGLRIQLAEKSSYCRQLQKQVVMNSSRLQPNRSCLYELEGSESLCSCLRIVPQVDTAQDISSCSIQWYRIPREGCKRELISGATKQVYAPEPFDVGGLLEAEIVTDDEKVTLRTYGPIDPAAGLGSYVEALVRKPETEFNVIVTQVNGRDQSSQSIHVFHVGKMRIKLCKGKSTKAKESYSSSMKLCGVRGGGDAAAQALFWQARKSVQFILVFESARERNAAIMLARRYASDCNVTLTGPDDHASTGN